jgi:hypothetical protein
MFRQVGVCLAIAVAAGITGCGSPGPTGPLASASVAAIIADATSNTLAAQSFTISGGTSATSAVDLTIVRNVGCTGTITHGTSKARFILIGATAYAHSAGMPADEWMKGSSSQASIQNLVNLCKPSSFLTPLLTATGVSSATRSDTVYDGQQALSLSIPGTAADGNQPATIVVTDTQAPVLLKIAQPGSGDFTFTGYGAAATIVAPTAS